jgi:adenosylcobinamide-GDP ribazoletransferase
MIYWDRLRQECLYIAVAVQFLTRLPVPMLAHFQPVWLDRSVAYFPLVGLLVGAISAGVYLAASTVWLQPISVILALAAGIAATGAFHEDGLADTADGLGGGLTVLQRLEIMKDSRIGTYGSVVLSAALALKATSLGAMSPRDGAIALMVAHAGGRIVPVLASAAMPYAGAAGEGKVQPVRPTAKRIALAVVFAGLPFALLPWWVGVVTIAVGGAAACLLLAKAWQLIGGQTGDVLGASEQTFEVAALLVLAGVGT